MILPENFEFDCSQLKIICILKCHILSHTQNPVMNNPSYSMKNLLIFFSFFVTIQFQKNGLFKS